MTADRIDPATLIRGGKLPRKPYSVCLEPDLVREHEDLLEQRTAVQEAGRDSLAGADTRELDQRIAELETQMTANTLTVWLRALPRPEFRALADKHPPRKDEDGKLTHQQDVIGVNYESFFSALLRLSIVEPELDAETVDLLLDERLTDRQWQDLTDVVWNLNRVTVNVPFLPGGLPNHRS
jgi:hypothetical protein